MKPEQPNERVMFITGASRGIGRALAERYLTEGWRVFGCSRGETTLDHPSYRHFSGSVSDEKFAREVFAAIQKEAGGLSVLINNAGKASMNHALLTPLTKLNELIEANLVGTFLFSREAAKMMTRKRYGRIVNFSTVAVPLRLTGEAAYVASKAGVVALTQVLARELGSLGVTVNAVGPTPVKTDLIRGVPDDKIAELLKEQAIERFGEMEDVFNVVDFFISPRSSFITGQVLYLGGI